MSKKIADPFICDQQSAISFSFREKTITKVKHILHQLLFWRWIRNKDRQNTEQAAQECQQQAQQHLAKLIQLALASPTYVTTESVLRLYTNHVEKHQTLSDMPAFFSHADRHPPAANLITVLIKHALKLALSQQQKQQLLLDLGLTSAELNSQNIADGRFSELSHQLASQLPNEAQLPSALRGVIHLARHIVAHQAINKMPVFSVVIELAPCITPKLNNSAEHLLTLVRFEFQVNALLKIALKSWIEAQ